MQLVVVTLAVLFTVRLGQQVQQYRNLCQEAETYRSQLTVAEKAYGDKLAQIDLLSNDAYIERLARARLAMVKAGESVVMAVDAELPTMTAVSDELDTTLRD